MTKARLRSIVWIVKTTLINEECRGRVHTVQTAGAEWRIEKKVQILRIENLSGTALLRYGVHLQVNVTIVKSGWNPIVGREGGLKGENSLIPRGHFNWALFSLLKSRGVGC